jgi:hypothetical protein
MALGTIAINKDSVKKNDDFVLERNGENGISLALKSDSLLKVMRNKTYTVKLELWAVGTHQTDESGNPLIDPSTGKVLALGVTNAKTGKFTAKSKPVLVPVKVFVK